MGFDRDSAPPDSSSQSLRQGGAAASTGGSAGTADEESLFTLLALAVECGRWAAFKTAIAAAGIPFKEAAAVVARAAERVHEPPPFVLEDFEERVEMGVFWRRARARSVLGYLEAIVDRLPDVKRAHRGGRLARQVAAVLAHLRATEGHL